MPRLTEKKLNNALYDARRILERAVNDARAVLLSAGMPKSDVGTDTRQLIKDLLHEDAADGKISTVITEVITETERACMKTGAQRHLATLDTNFRENLELRDLVECAYELGYKHRTRGIK